MESNKFKAEGIMEKGYGFIAKKVMKDRDLSIEAKSIYAYLSSYTGAGNVAYPSVSLMCGDLGISEARFYRHRKMLELKGYIVIEKHRNDKGWQNNVYTLPFVPTPQNLSTQNVSTQNVSTQNKGTKSNSFKSNSIKSNSIKKEIVEQSSQSDKSDAVPYKEIISYLNEQADRNFNHKASGNKDLIRARWNEGYDLDDFKQAIDNKVAHADDPNHFFTEEYLRPSTLFRKSNFDEYVNAVVKSRRQKVEVTTDFDNLSGLLGDGNE